jgi:hypothetical protein
VRDAPSGVTNRYGRRPQPDDPLDRPARPPLPCATRAGISRLVVRAVGRHCGSGSAAAETTGAKALASGPAVLVLCEHLSDHMPRVRRQRGVDP